MIRLFTDTDCDVTPDIAREYGYSVISMPYCIDGVTHYPYEDYENFDALGYYDTMRAGTMPTTSALTKDAYIKYFEPVFAAGDDILYVHFSSAMSSSADNMHLAIRELNETYPDRRVYTVDTKGISAQSLNMVREVGDLFLAGKTVDEILAWAEVEVEKFALYLYADDLKHFRRSGRCTGLEAVLGNMIGIRPIIQMNSEGKMVKVGKERGRKNALGRILQYIDELGEDVADHRIVIGHTGVPELAEEAIVQLKAKYGEQLRIEAFPVNPTIGAHCGPNCLGICFHAKHR